MPWPKSASFLAGSHPIGNDGIPQRCLRAVLAVRIRKQVDLNAPASETHVLGCWIDAAHTGRRIAKASCAAASTMCDGNTKLVKSGPV